MTDATPEHSPDEVGETKPDGLDDSVKEDIRTALKAVAERPGFRSRYAQRFMIAEVAKTLAGEYHGERVICVEGPTGTGKSLGYLLSAIPVARARDKTLIIATATVALQEQLVNQDLPDLQAETELDFSFALAKGRRRYVCDRNLERMVGDDHGQASLDLGHDDSLQAQAAWHIKPEAGEIETVKAMWQARRDGRFSGDLDDWDQPLRDELRGELTTDRNGCSGRSCAFRAHCPFFTARDQRFTHDVIVANHALALADLMLDGGAVLPAPEDSIYIFDEGHHLPDVAINQGAAQTLVKGPQSWLRDLPELPSKAARAATTPASGDALLDMGSDLRTSIPGLEDRLNDLHRYLGQAHPGLQADFNDTPSRAFRPPDEPPIWRFAMGQLPEELRRLFEQAWQTCQSVYEVSRKLNDKTRKLLEDAPDNAALATSQASLQWITGRLEAMLQALQQMATPSEHTGDGPPVARWIECLDDGRDYRCCASPTSAANLLRRILWQRCDGAVVTSATLAAMGRFDRFFEQAGLGDAYNTQAHRLASPFDYANNAELYIPALAARPQNHRAHTDEIIDRLDDGLIDPAAGSLMLFASKRQMRAVARGVSRRLSERILLQDSAPRQVLLATHRQRIDAGEGSILFGVASFSEGLDLPGDYCQHVLIAKIPFSVPDSPIAATLSEWLESRNRIPFIELSVPDAGFKLTQASGRLLRTEADTGQVTILDRRLVEKAYGRQMLEALPPFRRRIE